MRQTWITLYSLRIYSLLTNLYYLSRPLPPLMLIYKMNYKEQKILDGLRDGENWAYQHLYDHHYVLLCNIASTIVKDNSLAQNLVDDLIFNIFEKRDSLLITTSLRAYLVRATRNRCISHLRLKYQQVEINSAESPLTEDWIFSAIDENNTPLGRLLENELEQKILLAIEQLPPESRIVFEKSRYKEKDYATIAEELNISVNTVKYHIKNALSRLRNDLEKYLLLIFISSYFS